MFHMYCCSCLCRVYCTVHLLSSIFLTFRDSKVDVMMYSFDKILGLQFMNPKLLMFDYDAFQGSNSKKVDYLSYGIKSYTRGQNFLGADFWQEEFYAQSDSTCPLHTNMELIELSFFSYEDRCCLCLELLFTNLIHNSEDKNSLCTNPSITIAAFCL